MTSIHRTRDQPAVAPERRGSASYIPPPPSKKEVLQQKATAVPPADAARAASLDRMAQPPPPPLLPSHPLPAGHILESVEAVVDDNDEGFHIHGEIARRPSASSDAAAAAAAAADPPAGSATETVDRGGGGWAHFSDVDSDTGLISGSAAGRDPLALLGAAATDPAAAVTRKRRKNKAGDSNSDSDDSDDSDSEDAGGDNGGRGGYGVVGEDSDDEGGGFGSGSGTFAEALAMTREQREYYANQFLTLCPSLTGRVTGLLAKQFFEKSRLPPSELSRIWALSDRDMDGQLTLAEFSVAMHLVVLRRNNVPIPARLPAVCGEYTPLSDQEPEGSPPPPPPPPPPHQRAPAAAPPPEPSIFGGIPPSGGGVLHPTPRKPPTVPPRAGFPAPSAQSLAATSAPPNRERLLAAVKAQKEKNHTLVRLNNELAMELKEVTEQRIALELELERLKPLN